VAKKSAAYNAVRFWPDRCQHRSRGVQLHAALTPPPIPLTAPAAAAAVSSSCCCCCCHSLRKLTFSALSAHMDAVGPLCPIANHLVAQLSSFSSLTCLNLSGMSIVNGSGVHGDLAHSGLKQLILDNTESSGVTVRCAADHMNSRSSSNRRQ
jgi:hypothetical protein